MSRKESSGVLRQSTPLTSVLIIGFTILKGRCIKQASKQAEKVIEQLFLYSKKDIQVVIHLFLFTKNIEVVNKSLFFTK